MTQPTQETPPPEKDLQVATDDFRRAISNLAHDQAVPTGAVMAACAEMVVFGAMHLMEHSDSENKDHVAAAARELLENAIRVIEQEARGGSEAAKDQ